MKFVIKGAYYGDKTFPSLNDYIHQLGTNPKAGGRMKKEYSMIACNAIRLGLKRFQTTKPVILHYRFYEPLKGQKRDVMNVFSFADKVIEDSLIRCGVIQNDSPQFVKNTTHEFYYADEPRIEVEIEELDVVPKGFT